MLKQLCLFLLAAWSSVVLGYDATYYVVPGGAGAQNGTSWANAYPSVTNALNTLNLSSNAGYATPIVYIGSGSYTNLNYASTVSRAIALTFSGGWNTNSGVADGYSTFGGNISDYGFYFNKSSATHNQTFSMDCSRIIATNCVVGFGFYHANADNANATLRLTNCKGYASGTNVWCSYLTGYPFGGPICATNCTFVNAPVGIFNDMASTTYYLDGVTINASSQCLLSCQRASTPWWPYMELRRSVFTGAALVMNYTNIAAYNQADGYILMDACVVSNCGAVATVSWNGGYQYTSPPQNHQFFDLYLTNNLFANVGSGFNIQCTSGATLTNTGGYSVYSVNNTFLNCTNFAVQATTPVWTGTRNPTLQEWNTATIGSTLGWNLAAPNSPFTVNENHNGWYANTQNWSIKGASPALDATDQTNNPTLAANGSLVATSLYRNAGTNASAPSVDVAGLHRPLGNITDIGAYEFPEYKILSSPVSLDYLGSFDLPDSSGYTPQDYYYSRIVYVPNGNVRPGWGGAAVTGPTFLMCSSFGHYIHECYQIPALSKTSPSKALYLTNSIGGTTYFDIFSQVSGVTTNGDIWGGLVSDSGLSGMYSAPGTNVLGGTNAPTSVIETGWYNAFNYPSDGVLRRGDGNGNDLPYNGRLVGAKFLTLKHNTGAGYVGGIGENTRVSATNVVATNLFTVYQADYNSGKRAIQYVRATDNREYIVLLPPWTGNHTAYSTLDFYDARLTGGGAATPVARIDIGPAITAGAGWIDPASVIYHAAVDWDNKVLYVLDAGTNAGHGQQARVHAFKISGRRVLRTPSGAIRVGY